MSDGLILRPLQSSAYESAHVVNNSQNFVVAAECGSRRKWGLSVAMCRTSVFSFGTEYRC